MPVDPGTASRRFSVHWLAGAHRIDSARTPPARFSRVSTVGVLPVPCSCPVRVTGPDFVPMRCGHLRSMVPVISP
ncbi:MAG: hypothetical protein ACRDNW_13370 [Trebonia sp.]